MCRYQVGDCVWVRPEEARWDDPYVASEVTKIISELSVEVNGIPRHIRHLRRRRTHDEDVVEVQPGGSVVRYWRMFRDVD